MIPLPLHGEYLTLAQAVKVAGLADSGGQAKHLVRSGAIRVNGEVAMQPGKKLVPGDRFEIADGQQWVLTEPGAGEP
jgi:ribosome-associated protein